MTTGAALAQIGWKKAAAAIGRVFGTSFAQYRPAGPLLPVSPAFQLATALPGYITADLTGMTLKGFDPAKPRGTAAIDPSVIQEGDYLIGGLMQGAAADTFFVSDISAPVPPGVVRCNVVLNVTRPAPSSVFGAQPALDDQEGGEVVVLQGWPASMIREGRGERGDTGLPGDVKLGGFIVLLPPSVPASLRSGDILTDAADGDALRVIVAMAEHTPEGWKLLVQEAAT